jgi:LPXTG-site transpeptidase (sortase) family protein
MVQDNEPGETPPAASNSKNPIKSFIESIRGGRLSLPLIGGIAAVIVVGIILIVVAVGGGGDGNDSDVANARPTADSGGLQTDAEPTPEATIDLARPTAKAGHLENVGPNDRLVIKRFNINAPLTHRKVPPTGVMPNPDGPDDIAYYDFSNFENFGGAPGKGGNTVFAGHVDSGSKACKNGTVPPPCQAVLWDLNDLSIGDEIEVHVSGQVFKYAVTSNQPVPASLNDGTWDRIVTSTAKESLTIITCGGDFNRVTREYSNRQVVTAELIS